MAALNGRGGQLKTSWGSRRRGNLLVSKTGDAQVGAAGWGMFSDYIFGSTNASATFATPTAITTTVMKVNARPATFTTAIVVGDSIANGYSYATDPVPVQYGAAKLFGITAANWTNADANINPVWHTGSATAPFPNKSAYNASIGGMSALESADHPFTDARATYGGLVDLMIINLGGNDRLDDYTALRTEQLTTFTADAGTDVCTLLPVSTCRTTGTW